MYQNSTIALNDIYDPYLKVKGGLIGQKPDINKLRNVAWAIAYTALWNGLDLPVKEELFAREFIQKLLQARKDPMNVFSEFSQRLLLTREPDDLQSDNSRPLPSVFFMDGCNAPYSLTKISIDIVDFERKVYPMHMMEIRLFGIAVFEVCKYPDSGKFQAWKNFFFERGHWGLYDLFLNTVANCVFQMQTLSLTGTLLPK